MIFSRKPLDAIAQEVVISLRDEPDRWDLDHRTPWFPGTLRRELRREDGVSASLRESTRSPWPMYAVTVHCVVGAYHAEGRELKALRHAIYGWLAWREATSADRVRAFLAKAR